jgi:hypothetical protein
MAIQLFDVPSLPGRMAVSSVGGCVEGGTFLLDFSKPLKSFRSNKWLPFTTALWVPIIHQTQTEASAGFVVGVMRGTPEWGGVKRLWKLAKAGRLHTVHVPTGEYSGLQVIADFARQFPEFGQNV